ncbi:sulfurtransferase TusA family protein [Oscillibacter sp. 1-3]|uniref:sulfurtransferase TusA family protein n=1 Tax=Oscillibacter sp. 1-3 TaxID=1235797 RepID=UPI0003397FB6|nr:sulfurtransferase TusA family protein [Oscillibacter sp. 1-3]EOS64199.1 hypothetical protein C816_03066 [Oscillibacter sp. 1-3]MCI9511120.1 recombinase [Oscillibacter sp.]
MIDTRGFGCPTPVLMVREALQKDAPASLEVLADARVAVENVTRLARSMGYQVAETAEGLDFKLVLTKG